MVYVVDSIESLMGQLQCPVGPMQCRANGRRIVAGLRAIQALAIVVIRMVPIMVMVQIVVRIERLIRVIRMPYPTRHADRGHVHTSSRLVCIPLGEIIIEQRLNTFVKGFAVSGRAEIRSASAARARPGTDVRCTWYIGPGHGATVRALSAALA